MTIEQMRDRWLNPPEEWCYEDCEGCPECLGADYAEQMKQDAYEMRQDR